MSDPVTDRILANPKYHELRRRRNGFGWLLAACMLVVYYSYIALIAFDKPFLSRPVTDGLTTLGHRGGGPLGDGQVLHQDGRRNQGADLLDA